MDVYILDDTFKEVDVIDSYESLIWTERWQDLGDFQLHIDSTPKNRSLLSLETRLSLAYEYQDRVMQIETVEDTTEEGKNVLKVRGRSIESILESRIYKHGTPWNPSVLVDSPIDIIYYAFNMACIGPGFALSGYEAIPEIQVGSLDPGTIFHTSHVTDIRFKHNPDLTLNVLREVAKAYDLGFRIFRYQDNLYFDVYTGHDRTREQIPLGTGHFPNEVLTFGFDYDNIKNFTDFKTIQGAKNAIWVIFSNGDALIYADGVPFTVAGFDRKYMIHYAPDEELEIPGGMSNYDAFKDFGLMKLAEAREFFLMDGELDTTKSYQYGIDYFLGDKVEMINREGDISIRRVTESIRVSDSEGERSYPTLSEGIY